MTGRAGPSDFPRAKLRGNPEEQPSLQSEDNSFLPNSFTQMYILTKRNPFACMVVLQSMWKGPNYCRNFMESGSESATYTYRKIEKNPSSQANFGLQTRPVLPSRPRPQKDFSGATALQTDTEGNSQSQPDQLVAK